MSIEVKIPAVGESITSGLISTWHKKDGEQVNAGDALLTLETDKVSTEITAEKSGTLKIKVPEGEEVKIGDVVATIEEGDAPKAAEKPKSAKKKDKAEVLPPQETGRVDEPGKAEAEAKNLTETARDAGGVGKAKPTTTVTEEVHHEPENESPEVKPTAGESRITRQKMSPLRRKIAAQLVMAQQTAAILTTFNEADMTALQTMRAVMQEDFTKQYGIKLGFMSFFVKATVAALKTVPQINSRLDGDELILNHYFDIGVAVGTKRGLVVPIIRDADQKNFADIEKDIASYAEKARDGKIQISDLQGGVFTISNGGIYGSLLSTPILNPPQSGILGMHKIQPRPVALNGEVVIRPMMYLALSYDHRVVDGKEAVTFLVRLKEYLEEPARLLLGM